MKEVHLPSNLPDFMQQWVLRERPAHRVEERHFEIVQAPLPVPGDGQIFSESIVPRPGTCYAALYAQ